MACAMPHSGGAVTCLCTETVADDDVAEATMTAIKVDSSD